MNKLIYYLVTNLDKSNLIIRVAKKVFLFSILLLIEEILFLKIKY